MKMIIKLENLINKYLIKLFDLIISLTPRKIILFFHIIYRIIVNLKDFFVGLIQAGAKKTMEGSNSLLTYLKTYPYKEKIGEIKTQAKDKSQKIKKRLTDKEYRKKVAEEKKAKAIFGGFYFKTTLTIFFVFSIFIIYKNYHLIHEKLYPPVEDESVRKISNVRPPYYNKTKKQFLIPGFRFPIYTRSKDDRMKALILDITLESSNRFIAFYVSQFEHIIVDKIITELEPIRPSFPIHEEGKRMIRTVIKDQINQVLKQKNISGQINEVYIVGILTD